MYKNCHVNIHKVSMQIYIYVRNMYLTQLFLQPLLSTCFEEAI